MKTEEKLIYDSSCPMCRWYSAAFVQGGILPKDGRKDFNDLNDSELSQLDRNRARHEIPLILPEQQQVLYGLDSLFFLLRRRFPFSRILLDRKWFKAAVRPIYKFISYNRRIIAGTPTHSENQISAPDFHLGWRSIYLLICGMLSAFLFSILIQPFGAMPELPSVFRLFLLYAILFFPFLWAAVQMNKHCFFDFLGIQFTALTLALCASFWLLLIPGNDFHRWALFLSSLLFQWIQFRRMYAFGLPLASAYLLLLVNVLLLPLLIL